MLAPDLSPIHFWKLDSDSIEIKLGDLKDLKFAEFSLNDSIVDIDLLHLSPIKDKAVLNLLNRFKRGRGAVPGSANPASARRRMQSLKIARALDDLTCIAETPTRLSICRTGSICNVPSPASPVRAITPQPAAQTGKHDPELKYLFEVLGAATPYMHTPPSSMKQSQSHVSLQLCSLDMDDFLDFRTEHVCEEIHRPRPQQAQVTTTIDAVGTPKRDAHTRIPTQNLSSAKRSTSAPARREGTPGPSPSSSPRWGVNNLPASRGVTPSKNSMVASPARGRTLARTPVAASTTRLPITPRDKGAAGGRSLSPRPCPVQATPRSAVKNVSSGAQKKPTEMTSPIRTPKKNQSCTPVTPRTTKTPTKESPVRDNTPGYLRSTKNSVSSRSPSPARGLGTKHTPMSPIRSPIQRRLASPAVASKQFQSPVAMKSNTPKAVSEPRTPDTPVLSPSHSGPFGYILDKHTASTSITHTDTHTILANENLSPNITTRSRGEGGSNSKCDMSESPPIKMLIRAVDTPPAGERIRWDEQSAIDILLAEREKSNETFNNVMASCDDILAQLDAAVCPGPKSIIPRTVKHSSDCSSQ